MDSFMPSFLLEIFQHFSSNEYNNPVPVDITNIISKNLNDILNDTKEELSNKLVLYIKNDDDFTKCNNRFNPTFIGSDNVRTTIKNGELIKDNYSIDQVIKSIEKLSTYSDEIAGKILFQCLNDTKCNWNNMINIIDYAASQGYSYTCKLLYNTLGIKILIHPNNWGWTALHRSCYNNDIIAVNTLFEIINPEEIWKYINIPGSNMYESPLFVAATNECIDVIHLLLNTAGEKRRDYIMNDTNNRSSSLFNTACMNGHLEIVKLLVETVGNENILSLIRLHNENAFIGAASNNQTEIVNYLLEKVGDNKMDLLKTKNISMTALDYAAFNGRFGVVLAIIDHAGDRIKELDLENAIKQTHHNKNTNIEEFLNKVIKK